VAPSLHRSRRTSERVRERFVEPGFSAALQPQPSARRYERSLEGAAETRLMAFLGL
jgi:hypothetical protein